MGRDGTHGGRRPRGLVALVAILAVLSAAAGVAIGGRQSGSSRPQAPPTSEPTTSTTAGSTVPESVPSSVPPVVIAPGLAVALDRVRSRAPGACLSVSLGTQVLYEANPETPLVPASVAKILTAAAALDVLGDQARFRTTVVAAPVEGDGTVRGDLRLVGGGDPVLGTDAWAAQLPRRPQPYTSLDTLADRVVAAGVRAIEGRVVGDESRYDARRSVETWPRRFVADGEVGPLSALTVNDGFRVWGHPGVPFADPPAGAAAVFRVLLEARGVRIAGASDAGPPAEAVELAAVDSPPVGELVGAMLRESDNGTAELLVKEFGVRRSGVGSTAAGAAAVTAALEARGLPTAGSALHDGSGLSAADRVTCRLLTAVLGAAHDRFGSRLPVAGRDGTLSRRFVGTPMAGRLQAKTGSVDGVAALAGYVDNRAGQRLAFSYVVNGLPRSDSGRSLQDALAAALVTERALG